MQEPSKFKRLKCEGFDSQTKKRFNTEVRNAWSFLFLKGIKVLKVFSDIASGIAKKNANNFLICSMNVIDGQVSKIFIIINYFSSLSRVGFGLFKHLFLKFSTEIIVANLTLTRD